MDYHDFCGIRQWVIIDLQRPEPPLELDPYEKLFLAILMDAVETLKKPSTALTNRYIGKTRYKTRQAQLNPVADAEAWLMSDDEAWPLGFTAICHYFGWSHTWIRKKVLEAIENAKAEGQRGNRRLALPGPRSRKLKKTLHICPTL